MQDGPVAITGVGLVTALGLSAWANARALLDGRTTPDRLAQLEPGADAATIAKATGGVGRVRITSTDPAVALGEMAAREALDDASRCPGAREHRTRARCVVASSKGAVLSLAGLTPARVEHGDRRAREAPALGPHGLLATELARRLDLGAVTSPVAACATSMYALHEARREIIEGRADRVVVIGVESALHPLFVESYRRLGVLAPTSPQEKHRCLALDERRAGFTLCECGVCVVLERAELAPGAGMVLERTGVACEPHDLIRPASRFDGLERLVRRLVGDADDLVLVHPHATGTPGNDERELRALSRALGESSQAPDLYASKGAIGHPLGASGLVNVVLSCMFARVGRRAPMGWLERPIGAGGLTPDGAGRRLDPGVHLVVSAGFGGHLGGCLLRVRERARA